MCTPIAALVVVALLQSGSAATGRAVTLTLAHPLHSGETAWLEVEIGPIERGAEIEIATTDGRPLGIISPYAIRSGDSAGTYTVPVPDDAISKNRVLLRLSLNQHGHASRAPTAKEVKGIRLKIKPTV
jgi:propanediol utilization protein